MAVLIAGCLLLGGSSLVMAADPESNPATGAEAAAAQTLQTVELTAAGERAATVALRVDGPLSWTRFDDEGTVVVELRGVTPAAGIAPLSAAAGPVRSVLIETDSGGDEARSRVTIATRGAVRADAEADADRGILLLHVRAVEEPALAAAEPVMPPVVGSAEEPLRGPEPASGLAGAVLREVSIKDAPEGTAVILRGDGQFRYASFVLDEPARFVLDLEGVAKATAQSSFRSGGEPLRRVRVAQFRSDPDRVARVVFDLDGGVTPRVEPAADGLRVYFPHPAAAAPVVAAAEPVARTPGQTAAAAGFPTERVRSAPQSTSALPAPEEPEVPVLEEPAAPVEPPPPPPPPPVEPDLEPQVEDVPVEPILTREAPARPSSSYAASSSVDAPVNAQDTAASAFAPTAVQSGQRQYYGDPISLTVIDSDLKETLRSFAQFSGLNTVIHPGTTGTVTVELHNVPWDQALEQILKMNNLAYQIEGNIMRIAPREQFQREAQAEQELAAAEALSVPLRTVVKRVSYATASDVASVLQGSRGGSVISERGSVIVDGRTNTLIIRELPRYIDTVLAIIEHLDTPEPQVHIEARIVETSKQFSRSLGIQWGAGGIADAAHGNTTGLQFPNNIEGAGGVNLLTGGANGLLGISMGNVLNTFTLDMTLQAAESEGLANILSSPSVTVLNNEQAEIQSGLSIPIQTVANNTVSVQFVNATLRLQVTPHVTADGTVLMDINIQKREPRTDLIVPGATNAPIATKEARTRVIVRDGGTTVLGGIYEVSSSEGEARVPGLANIPILGHLFRNKNRDEQNEELLIFITPRVQQL